jgi:S1 RNA binding domain protein
MEFSEGDIVTGKVTGIMKFGAFVSLPGDKSGLVHISEISNTYVNDIHDCLTEGQVIRVKILAIDKNGRINLSIKRVEPAPSSQPQRKAQPEPVLAGALKRPAPANESFEDKLKAFMKDSESKFSDMKNPPDRKGGTPRRLRTK